MMNVKKLIGLAMLAGAATGVTTTAASAEDGFSANVALTSNYVWRGITQSDQNFAVQGGIDYTHGMFYAGTWASSVDDFGVDASTELDAYLGITPSLGPVAFDIGVVGYFYPGAAADIDFAELKLGASINPTEAFSLGLTAFLTDDFGGSGDDATYVELSAGYDFSAFSVSGGYGNQDIDGADYDTWNLGVGFSAYGFGFDVRYFDTDITGADEEYAFTISRDL